MAQLLDREMASVTVMFKPSTSCIFLQFHREVYHPAKSNGRFVDAHEITEKDFALVTRTAQNNDTQRWVLTHLGGHTYTIQQKAMADLWMHMKLRRRTSLS